jgi:type VI secretion system secreted protein VgrG
MIATMTQKRWLLSARIGTLPDDLLVPVAFSGCEAISTLFCFSLRLVSDQPDNVDPQKIPGMPVAISLELANGSHRVFHGYVSRFSRGERGPRYTEFQAQVVPWLWFLTLTADCRIYQDMTVPDILRQVFQDNGFLDFRSALTGEHIARDYCVQYRETDFHFVSRLMEEEGIWYYFEHTQDKHTLVFTDSLQSHQPCPEQSQFHYRPGGGEGIYEDMVTSWELTRAVRSDRWTVRDYHFQMPDKNLEFSRESPPNGHAQPRWEVFDYPGDYALRFNKPGQRLEKVWPEGEKVVRLRLEEEETPHVEVDGASECRSFIPGHTFELLNPPADSPQGPYLLTSVHHAVTQGSVFGSGDMAEESYANTFRCLVPGGKFRPDRGTEKPVVAGPQTAVVVGAKDKEIDVDMHGRVKVQFHWDRYGKKNENSSCWLRVAQVWAGKRWGASFWPRIGQEVIVAFLEGDPDQPIIVGSVYNDIQRPPYLGDGPDPKHPHEPKLSGVKTCSTPGGNGFNEIRFDDTKGKEQLFLRAEGQKSERVNGDSFESIGHDRHLIVHANQLERVLANKNLTVEGDQFEAIKGSLAQDVRGDVHLVTHGTRVDTVDGSVGFHCYGHHYETVGKKDIYVKNGDLNIGTEGRFTVGSARSMHLNADKKIIVESASYITLKAGGSYIEISDEGVEIWGPNIWLNCGSPDPGMGVGDGAWEAPADAEEADPAAPLEADEARTGFPSAPGAKIAPSAKPGDKPDEEDAKGGVKKHEPPPPKPAKLDPAPASQ